MLDDEGVEGFNVGIESEELVLGVTGGTVQGGGGGDQAGVRGTVSQPAAVVVVVTPYQLLARGLR